MATATMEPKPVKLTPGLLAWFGLVGVLLLIGITAAITGVLERPGSHQYERHRTMGSVDHDRPVCHRFGRGCIHAFGHRVYLWHQAFPADRPPGGVRRLYRLHFRLADPGDGHWSPGPLLAPVGILEHPLGPVGDHLVYHHLPDDHAAGVSCR